MLETIEFKGNVYPAWQASGFAARFAFPFAKEVCKGGGLDIGPMKSEWALPKSYPIDTNFNDPWEAMNLPKPPHGRGDYWDYIFSSHCLEHLPDWVKALDYWHTRLRTGGVVFLYLPDMDNQLYWCGWNNRKHIHYLTPAIIKKYFETQPEMWKNTIVSGTDLNSSFICISEKV